MAESSQPTVDYSIVIPVYYNEGLLTKTMQALKEHVLDAHPDLRAEVIFVDDGSGDGSFDELLRVRRQDPETIKVIKLTRNFGQVNALLAGFSWSHGKCVVAMSADGQDPVTLINDMLKAHFDEHFEIVICTRTSRDESPYRILTSKLFYALVRKLSFPNMPPGGFDFVLMGRRALNTLLRNREAHPFFQGQLLWMGYSTRFIQYQRQRREIGKSRWTFHKKLLFMIDSVVSYSFFPIRFASALGAVISLLGFLYALVIFVSYLIGGNPVQGWAPLMMVTLILGGAQMLMLGAMGEYIWRMLAQVRSREQFIVDAVYASPEPDVPAVGASTLSGAASNTPETA